MDLVVLLLLLCLVLSRAAISKWHYCSGAGQGLGLEQGMEMAPLNLYFEFVPIFTAHFTLLLHPRRQHGPL